MSSSGFKKFRNTVDVSPTAAEMRKITDHWQISNEVESIPMDDVMSSHGSKKLKALYAARGRRAKKPSYRAFRQPYIGLDTFFLQDIYANTPAGRVVDFISYLITGGGFRPVLKMRDASQYDDQVKVREELDEADREHGITDSLIRIDRNIGNPDGNATTYEHTFEQKVDGMLKMALVYGKGMQVRIPDGKTYDLYPIHPRDIVYNIVDDSWKLQAILTTLAAEPYTMDQVVYAEWNPENPIYNIMYNGFSFMQRMLDPARALRRIKGTDMQIIAQKRWAGSAIIAMSKRDGKSDAKNLTKSLDAGKIYATEEPDPEKAYHVHPIPLETASDKITDMATWLTHDIISLGGVPTTLFYDESSANHNVFDIRIRAFQKQMEEEFRPWASAILTKQWYMRNYHDLFGDRKEIYEKFEVECEFEPIDFSSLEERAKALKMINDIFPVTPEFAGEHMRIENFPGKVDTTVPRPEKKQEFQITRESDTDSKMTAV